VTVTAVYDGAARISKPRRQKRSLRSATRTRSCRPHSGSLPGLAVIAVGLGVWWYRRAGGTGPGDGAAGDGEPTAGGPTAGTRSADTSSPSPDAVKSSLERASEQLSNGRPDDAARTGYAAVRRALASRIDGSDALTHWSSIDGFEPPTRRTPRYSATSRRSTNAPRSIPAACLRTRRRASSSEHDNCAISTSPRTAAFRRTTDGPFALCFVSGLRDATFIVRRAFGSI